MFCHVVIIGYYFVASYAKNSVKIAMIIGTHMLLKVTSHKYHSAHLTFITILYILEDNMFSALALHAGGVSDTHCL